MVILRRKKTQGERYVSEINRGKSFRRELPHSKGVSGKWKEVFLES